MRALKIIILFSALFFSLSALAEPLNNTVNINTLVQTPDKLKWGNPKLFAKGAHDSLLYASRDGGPYTVRVKFPKNFKVYPFYSKNILHITVLKGELMVNTGDTFNEKAGYKLKKGGFLTVPENVAMYFYTRDKKTIIQIHGEKLSGIAYIDKAKAAE